MPYVYTVRDEHGVQKEVVTSPDLILDAAAVIGGPRPPGWMVERDFHFGAPEGTRVVWGPVTTLRHRIAEALAQARARGPCATAVADKLEEAYEAAKSLQDV